MGLTLARRVLDGNQKRRAFHFFLSPLPSLSFTLMVLTRVRVGAVGWRRLGLCVRLGFGWEVGGKRRESGRGEDVASSLFLFSLLAFVLAARISALSLKAVMRHQESASKLLQLGSFER